MIRADKRFWLGAGLVAALVVVGAVAVNATAYHAGGPLAQVDEIAVRFPLEVGQPGTWGMVLPPNDAAEPIVIESVEAVDPTGLDVIGITTNDPDRDGGIGAVEGYPPRGAHTSEVAGSVVPPVGSAARHLQLLIGVMRTTATEGSIASLRIRYSFGDERFEDVLPWALRTIDPPS